MADSEAAAGATARVRALVEERLAVVVPDDDTDLIDAGLIDSLALVTLIVALEEAFATVLPLEDFDIDRFRSVRRITDYLAESGVLEARSW